MTSINFPQEEIDHIIKLYHDLGWTTQKIADLYKVSTHVIKQHLRSYYRENPGKAEERYNKFGGRTVFLKPVDSATIQEMISLYFDEGYTTSYIAEKFGLTKSAVAYHTRKYYDENPEEAERRLSNPNAQRFNRKHFSRGEIREVILAAGDGNEKAFNRLLNHYQKSIRKAALSFGVPENTVAFDELIQAGRIGLWKAVTHIDECKHGQFAQYINFWIYGCMQIEYGKLYGGALTINEQRSYNKILQYVVKTYMHYKELPSAEELSNKFNKPVDFCQDFLDKISKVTYFNDMDLAQSNRELVDELDSSATVASDFNRVINKCSTELTPQQKDVLEQRYKNENTLESVGKKYGVSRERIRQVENKGLRKLANQQEIRDLGGLLD